MSEKMIERELEIINRLGLHARAAAKLVHTAGQFSCNVTLVKGDERVDAKSILGIMALGAAQGTKVKLVCEGVDAAEAVEAVAELINQRFGEDA